jgi:hypothetical protein
VAEGGGLLSDAISCSARHRRSVPAPSATSFATSGWRNGRLPWPDALDQFLMEAERIWLVFDRG